MPFVVPSLLSAFFPLSQFDRIEVVLAVLLFLPKGSQRDTVRGFSQQRKFHHHRPYGPMARRLTSTSSRAHQKIEGSTPSGVTMIILLPSLTSLSPFDGVRLEASG